MSKNIVLDFSQQANNQPVAVMPAELAKRLLKLYAAKLTTTSAITIMDEQLEALGVLKQRGEFDAFVQANLDFANERQLIENVSKENWSAYEVEQP